MRSFFPRCCDGDRHGGTRPGAATCPTLAKQPDAASRHEMPQPTRMKNDPKSFSLRPYNDQASAAAAHDCTGRRRLQAVLGLP